MNVDLSLLWTWRRTVGRLPYLLVGATLFPMKFAIDWVIARHLFSQPWSPWYYLVWPNDRALGIFQLTETDRTFALTMIAVSLPFIWTGVVMTLHRLRSSGLPLALVALFFVPLINFLMFFILCLLPTKPELVEESGGIENPVQPRPPLRDSSYETPNFVRDRMWVSGLLALLITVPVAVLAVFVGAEVLQSYGFSLFVGGPFTVGMVSVLIFGFSYPKPFGSCVLVAFATAAVVALALLVVALEGAVCLIMAVPIATPLVLLGAVVGYAIQSRPWLNDQIAGIALLLIVLLPALMAAEAATEPEPSMRAVVTDVVVNAEPEVVWPLVIAFPPLAEPNDWFFKTGVAYPVRAEIKGEGVGAIRHCVFSTGDFVEPIEVWDAPKLLQFRVTEQPDPMREWSPYHIHPPHLDRYLVSHKGQFRLIRQADGCTRLEGTTWYTNRMWPEAYWSAWSDLIIHRIHGRVLNHIQTLAERGN